MKMNETKRHRSQFLFAVLISFFLCLFTYQSANANGVVSLPLNYEANQPWPLWPWYAHQENPLFFVQPLDGILTLDKDWPGEPHVLYSVEPLDFISSEGVTIDVRLKLDVDNSSPAWLSVTDENLYFAFLFIYPDRIQRHIQNDGDGQEFHEADFTKWRELKVVFWSKRMLLFLDGQKIMDSEITGKYIGDYARCARFGFPGGVQLKPNNGPSRVHVDYLRIGGGNSLSATVDIKPDTLNLKSHGEWVTCYIIPKDNYHASDIDISSIFLEDLLEVQHSDLQNGVLMVKFDRQALITYLRNLEELHPPDPCVPLTVSGCFYDGVCFEGIDEIKVIDDKN